MPWCSITQSFQAFAIPPGGSTAGAEGIELAHALAERSFRKNGVNRVLLATDGDCNVGITNTNELEGFVEREREKGVFLSFLGFGEGNYRDDTGQILAQNGNGVGAYNGYRAEFLTLDHKATGPGGMRPFRRPARWRRTQFGSFHTQNGYAHALSR